MSTDENTVNTAKPSVSISVKAFVTAVIILLALMIGSYTLTFLLPKGEYVEGVYEEIAEGGITFWQFLASPILALTAEGGANVILIIALILVIGGVFYALDKSNILQYALSLVVDKFKDKKYTLLAVMVFFFMFLGSTIGMFEEVVPLVPIVVMLAYSMGWDAIVGLSASILAVCCGFSCGVLNPFTTGVSFGLAVPPLPIFTGIFVRIGVFILVYLIVMFFIISYAKAVEKNPKRSVVYTGDLAAKASLQAFAFESNARMNKALKWFALNLLTMFLLIFALMIYEVTIVAVNRPDLSLSDIPISMILVVFFYGTAGIGAAKVSGIGFKQIGNYFVKGIVSIAPAIFMLLLAASIKYILDTGKVLDTILFQAINVIGNSPAGVAILLIYAVILVINFFIPSGSAKAVLLMPLIFAIISASNFDIKPENAVLAFLFGDGFSNVLYPTNPVLLISLSLTTVNYAKWVKWSFKIQLTLLAVLCLALLLVNMF